MTFILVAIFLALLKEKSDKRPQNVAQVAIRCHSEHHAVFSGCQHQRYPHDCLGQGTGAKLSMKMCSYRLQHVQLQSSQHCQEQKTGVTLNLVRALNIYSKAC